MPVNDNHLYPQQPEEPPIPTLRERFAAWMKGLNQ